MNSMRASSRWLKLLLSAVALCAALLLLLAAVAPYSMLKATLGFAMPDGDFRSLNPGNVLAFRGLFLLGGLLCGGVVFLASRRTFSVYPWLARRRQELMSLVAALKPAKDKTYFVITLALQMVLGLIIRLPYLWAPLHHDQAYTVVFFAPRLWTALTDYHVPNNHIFHTVLVHFAISAFGIQPWAVRLPALLAGVLMIPATYLLGKAIYDRHTGLMAALLVTVAPIAIFYTTIARGYALLGLITLLVLWLGDFVRKDRNILAWFLLAFFSALGFWTMPIMLLPFGMLFTWLLMENWVAGGGPYGSRLDFLRYWMAAGLGTLTFTFLLYTPALIFTGFWKVVTNNFHFPIGELLAMLHRHVISVYAAWSGGVPNGLAIFLEVGFLLGLVFHWRLSVHRFPMQLAGLIWFAAVLVIIRPLPWTRIWFFLMAPALIWCSAGIVGLLKNVRIKQARELSVSALLIALLMIYPVVAGWQAVMNLPQARTAVDSDEAAVLFIDDRLQENDLIIAPFPQNPIILYYARLHGISDVHFDASYPYDRAFLLVQPAQGQKLVELQDRYGLTAAVWDSPKLLQSFRGLEIYLVEKR